MVEKREDEVCIYFLDSKIVKHIEKGIVALLVLQVINIIYLLVNKLQFSIYDLGFSYIAIFFMVLRIFVKKRMKIPDIIMKDKFIILGDIKINIEDVTEIKDIYLSIIISYKINGVDNMIKIYSSDSKKKRDEIKKAIEEYIIENKENEDN